jgi:cation diffusion facilitator CzcD-associated flavoprotein CzcO
MSEPATTAAVGGNGYEPLPAHVRVAIVGSGFAGLGTAIRLRQEGMRDFLVFEKDPELGGTWWANTYPGAACDVPSLLYSFSFAPNPNWSRSFSPQGEILDYLRDCADRFGVRPHIRFRHEVRSIRWDAAANVWHVDTSRGALTAQIVVGGLGPLSVPALPDIRGVENFEGTLFHSAQWNHDHDLTGENVAVIGTGASSIQFVPEIQPRVGRLHIFQRTPPWVIPRTDRALKPHERRLFQALPALQQAARAAIYWGRELYAFGFNDHRRMKVVEKIARAHLERQIADPGLRAKLTPSYTIGCKRILLSNDWYPTLTKSNVELVTSGITEVRPRSVVTADGNERPVDTMICGTGFHVTDFPAGRRIFGADGRSLTDVWDGAGGMEAYKGTTVAGFPNLFLLIGPNTGLGHTSMVFMMESQFAYVLDALRHMDRTSATTVDVRPDVQSRYNDDIQRRLTDTVWNAGGCRSWYLDPRGRNTSVWPGYTWKFRQITRRFDPPAYVVRRDPVRPGLPAPDRATPAAATRAAGTVEINGVAVVTGLADLHGVTGVAEVAESTDAHGDTEVGESTRS